MTQSNHREVRLTAIKAALKLVSTDSLSTYEYPAHARVAELAVSLHNTQILINPIIVDDNLRLLIDGHHRLEAFRWLGINWIPAFSVSYLSDCVRVCGWSRVTTASSSDVRTAFDAIPASEQEGCWKVFASRSPGETIAQRSFETAALAARYVDRVTLYLSVHHTVTIEPTAESLGSSASADRVEIYMNPIVGKTELLATVKRHELLAPQVNRHLVTHRPLQMNIPLSSLVNKGKFDSFLDNLFKSSEPTIISAGTRHDYRIYEEAVVMFQNKIED